MDFEYLVLFSVEKARLSIDRKLNSIPEKFECSVWLILSLVSLRRSEDALPILIPYVLAALAGFIQLTFPVVRRKLSEWRYRSGTQPVNKTTQFPKTQ
jgi:hypothetical protein